MINKNELKALPRKIYLILEFPEPEDETEIKRFLGLCGQFGKNFPDLSHMGKPLRELLKKGNTFHFGPVERTNFNDIKEAIGGKMALVTYDPHLMTRIYHDASETGLVYVVIQKHVDDDCWCKKEENKCVCKWKIIWCSSRALKPSYKGLPPLYLEALGHHWAITDAQYYLKECRNEFQAVSDHYPLLSLT